MNNGSLFDFKSELKWVCWNVQLMIKFRLSFMEYWETSFHKTYIYKRTISRGFPLYIKEFWNFLQQMKKFRSILLSFSSSSQHILPILPLVSSVFETKYYRMLSLLLSLSLLLLHCETETPVKSLACIHLLVSRSITMQTVVDGSWYFMGRLCIP